MLFRNKSKSKFVVVNAKLNKNNNKTTTTTEMIRQMSHTHQKTQKVISLLLPASSSRI